MMFHMQLQTLFWRLKCRQALFNVYESNQTDGLEQIFICCLNVQQFLVSISGMHISIDINVVGVKEKMTNIAESLRKVKRIFNGGARIKCGHELKKS